MIERCDDPNCPGYGQEMTDRGYGYPVCPANKWYSERFLGSENKPLRHQIEVSPEIAQQYGREAAAYVEVGA